MQLAWETAPSQKIACAGNSTLQEANRIGLSCVALARYKDTSIA